MKFEHDEKNHTYHLDGVRLISTTDLLERFGLSDFSMVDPSVLAEAASIGTAVSEAVELLDKGKSWKKYAALAGYVEAWKVWKSEYGFKPDLIEEPLHDEEFLFATRPDRYGQSRYGPIVVQIKTCRVEDYVAIQTAAEERAILCNGYPIERGYGERSGIARKTGPLISSKNRYGVELMSNGKFKTRQFDNPNDLKVFLGMLAAGRWLRNHGKWKLKGE